MNDEKEKTDKPPVEDWTISEPDIQAGNFDITMMNAGVPQTSAVAEEWATDVPNTNPSAEKPLSAWEMPPVFRVSSGRKLQKSNRKTPPPPSDSPPVQTQSSEIAAPNPDIQPQSFVSEESSVSQVEIAETPAKTAGNSSKLILLIIGLAVLAVLAAAFLAGIYIWYFHLNA